MRGWCRHAESVGSAKVGRLCARIRGRVGGWLGLKGQVQYGVLLLLATHTFKEQPLLSAAGCIHACSLNPHARERPLRVQRPTPLIDSAIMHRLPNIPHFLNNSLQQVLRLLGGCATASCIAQSLEGAPAVSTALPERETSERLPPPAADVANAPVDDPCGRAAEEARVPLDSAALSVQLQAGGALEKAAVKGVCRADGCTIAASIGGTPFRRLPAAFG